MKPPTIEERKAIRRAIKRCKIIRDSLKPLEKDYETNHDFVKSQTLKFKRDFDFPEGKTVSYPTMREGYNTDALDELLESGLVDSDTAALIRKTRYSTPGVTVRIS